MTLFRRGEKYKKAQFLTIFTVLLASAAVFTYVYADNYSNWAPQASSAQTDNWKDIASSDNGAIMYAVRKDDYVYKSTDGGTSWVTLNASEQRRWTSVATSAGGDIVLAATDDGDNAGMIFFSADAGVTWSEGSVGERSWRDLAYSNDGNKAAAVAYGDYVYTTVDSGISWAAQTQSGQRNWSSIAISADGNKLAAAVNGGDIYTSTNAGSTWTWQTGAGSAPWSSIASSDDGDRLAVASSGNGGQVFLSNNAGSTWSEAADLIGRDGADDGWVSITSSADGYKLAVASDGGNANGPIYTSVDGGVTWSKESSIGGDKIWRSVVLSADGIKIGAVSSNSFIYTANDNLAPNIPSIPDLVDDSDSGASNEDDVTSDNTPTFLVTGCEPGATVQLNIVELGDYVSGTCGSDRTVQIDGSTIEEGNHSIIARQTDTAGNISDDSGALTLTIDTTAPEAPGAAPEMTDATDSGSSNSDNITNDTTPDFTGSCSNGYVRYYFDGSSFGVVSCSEGLYTFTSPSASSGDHTYRVRFEDVAGNASVQSSILTVTIDVTPPSAPGTPDLHSSYDSGSSNTDNITNITTAVFTGICNTNDNSVYIYSNGVLFITSPVCTSNTYAGSIGTLSEGIKSITAKEVDLAGNLSSASSALSVTIDTTAPTTSGAPDMTAGTDSGVSSTDNITSNTTPIFTGSCTDGNAVQLYNNGTILGGSSAICASSVFSITASALSSGSNAITFKETDTAGNVSTASTGLTVTIDTTSPSVSLSAPADGASVAGAAVTVSADASDGVGVYGVQFKRNTNTLIGAEDTISAYSVSWDTTALSDGSQTLIAVARDAAGNYATSTSRTVTVDNTAPTISSVSSDKAAGSYTVGEVIDIDVTFAEAVTSTGNVTVTLETGATDRTCTFSVSGATTGTCNYTVQSGDTSLDLTTNSISGTIADAAGNAMVSFTPGTNLAANEAIVVDTTAPVISEVTPVTTPTNDTTPDYTFTSSEAGIISYGGGCTSATTLATSGSNTITLSSLADGAYASCTVTVTDAPGNASNVLTMTSFTVDTSPDEESSGDNDTPNTSGGGGGSGYGYSYNTVYPTPVDTFIETLNSFIPSFLRPTESEENPTEPTVATEEPEESLLGNWDLIPKSTISEFVLKNLPSQIVDLISKFPELGKVFASVGVENISDLGKLHDITFNLPKIADSNNPPSDFILAKTSGGIDVSTSINIGENGIVEQKIHTLGGEQLTLKIKPEGAVNSIEGYMTFKRSSETAAEIPMNSILASAIMKLESFGEKAHASEISSPELLIFSFEYTDPDGDGIYTADIETPKVEGEYEVITIINYTDKKQGSKELRMVTVIDPEGYVYELDNRGREVRISSAEVSIYQVTTSSEILWDAKKYSQNNPQITGKTGKYAFLVPEGKYYITVKASGYDLYKSEHFDIREGNPVHENIELQRKNGWLYNLLDLKMAIILIISGIFVTRLIYRKKN